jgi:hypothetical protein
MVSAIQVSIGVLLCSISILTPAATVHRWVDEHGVTHFSDAPPAGGASDVKILELSDDFPAAPDTRTNYYSIANQWERMRDERDQKTRVELEKARIRAEKGAAVAYSEPAAEPEERRYYPVYFPRAANRGRAHRQPHYDVDDGAQRAPYGRARNGRSVDGTLGRGEQPSHRGKARSPTPAKPMRLR